MLITTILNIIFVAALIFLLGRRLLIMLNPNVKNVSAKDANVIIKEKKDILILDVRTKEEYANGHIPNAKLMPVQELPSRIGELEQYKSKPVLVYCASGGRSPRAVSTLIKNNFSEIYHLSSGISSWPYSVKR